MSIAIISVPPSCTLTPVAPSITSSPSEDISLTASTPNFKVSLNIFTFPNEPIEVEEPLYPPAASIVSFEPVIKFDP